MEDVLGISCSITGGRRVARMDITNALFFWYIGYWVWIGFLFDHDDNDDESLTPVQHLVWLLYPIAIPILLSLYLIRQVRFWAAAFIEDVKDKLEDRKDMP